MQLVNSSRTKGYTKGSALSDFQEGILWVYTSTFNWLLLVVRVNTFIFYIRLVLFVLASIDGLACSSLNHVGMPEGIEKHSERIDHQESPSSSSPK
jgi:hypothetical protein